MSDPRGTSWIAWTVAIVSLVVLGFFWFGPGRVEDPGPKLEPDLSGGAQEYLDNAEDLFEAGNFAAARKVARTAAEIDPALFAANILAGEASLQLEDAATALEYFSKVPRTDTPTSEKAAFGVARSQFQMGSYENAESSLRYILSRDASHVGANDLLSELLDVEGRRWESLPYALELTRQGAASLEAMILLADDEFVLSPNTRATEAMRGERSAAVQLGIARSVLKQGERERGLELLQAVLNQQPDLVEAQTLWGEHLLDDNPARFAAWHAAMQQQADTHPRMWFLRGVWAMRAEQPKPAARCFWEVLRRHPNHRPAHFQLAKALTQLQRSDDAKPLLDRGLRLSTLKRVLEPVIAARHDSLPEELTDVIVILEALGRNLEARQWTFAASDAAGESPSFEPLSPAPTTDKERLDLWVQPDSNPSIRMDLSDYGLPVIKPPTQGATDADNQSTFAARFQNHAQESQLDFTYVAAPDETTEGKRMIEFTGGGVAALDYDLDNHPDVFFTQGGLIPAQEKSQLSDKLFRNVGSTFVDTTSLAGVAGTEFGQGVAVGDLNADGFPDLFVANFGTNRFYTNNGDGTFSDCSSILQQEYVDWSTSAVMADLNGDSLPDLYVANYLAGDAVGQKICQLNDSMVPRVCTPDQFEAAQDRVYLNLGDGRFADRTDSSGICLPLGKGLGLLAADFQKTGNLQLFVANDGVPNFLFSVQREDFVFKDTAAVLGVATDGDGLAQACMGVASADVNQDGYLDFLVTNFERESNTMYLGGNGLFDDTTPQARLREPSVRMLGFGAQCVDGDLDGDADLVVVNGHVDDFSHQGTAYRMRPQYFQNNGRGVFKELMSPAIGSVFGRKELGRSLCRLDFNRDGQSDLAVSNLDTPAGLLANVSRNTGHFLRVKLIGTVTNRDAIGTIVNLVDGDWRQSQQLVAGDGYQCSNERVLTFGLGSRTSVPVLTVEWLDRSSESFTDIPVDSELVIVQGSGRCVVNVD